MSTPSTPATAAQKLSLEHAIKAFYARYEQLQSLPVARLTAPQRTARAELLASGAKIESAISNATGLQLSVQDTLSSWWKGAKKVVGLNGLPLLLVGATATTLMASITFWLSSKAWSTIIDAGIKKDASELATNAFQLALSKGATPEKAAEAAAGAASAAGVLASKDDKLPSFETLAKYGVIGVLLIVALNALPLNTGPRRPAPRRR